MDPFVSDSIMLYFMGLTGRKCYRHIVTQRIRGFPVLKYEPKDLTLSVRTKSLNVWFLLLVNETSYYGSTLTWKKDGRYGHHLGIPVSTALYEKDPFVPYYSGFHLNIVSRQVWPWIKLNDKKKINI